MDTILVSIKYDCGEPTFIKYAYPNTGADLGDINYQIEVVNMPPPFEVIHLN